MLLVGALFIPVIRPTRGPSHRISCLNNLQQLTKALLAYKATNGQLPPPYVTDESGKPMHSWRVLILPYLGQDGLYQAYRFDEPWDGPNNSKLHNLILDIYRCPSGRFGQTETSYVALVGPGTAWDTTGGLPMQSPGAAASQTIVLVEMADSGIHWMEPRDLDIRHMAPTVNSSNGPAISSNHGETANVAFADGRVQVMTNEMLSPLLLRIVHPNAEQDEETADR
jgi:prepilin-type processing-associated H-X9-DG protein